MHDEVEERRDLENKIKISTLGFLNLEKGRQIIQSRFGNGMCVQLLIYLVYRQPF